ncbi:hypothetical protein EDB85DRAFT_2271970, partial [Lactarius pseudohatsudake]
TSFTTETLFLLAYGITASRLAPKIYIPQHAPNKSSPALHTRYTSAIYPCKNSRRTSSARSSATTTAEVCCTIARAVRVASTGHTNIWVEDTAHDEQHIWHLSAANVDLAQHRKSPVENCHSSRGERGRGGEYVLAQERDERGDVRCGVFAHEGAQCECDKSSS